MVPGPKKPDRRLSGGVNGGLASQRKETLASEGASKHGQRRRSCGTVGDPKEGLCRWKAPRAGRAMHLSRGCGEGGLRPGFSYPSCESGEGSGGQATGVPVIRLRDHASREDNALSAHEVGGTSRRAGRREPAGSLVGGEGNRVENLSGITEAWVLVL